MVSIMKSQSQPPLPRSPPPPGPPNLKSKPHRPSLIPHPPEKALFVTIVSGLRGVFERGTFLPDYVSLPTRQPAGQLSKCHDASTRPLSENGCFPTIKVLLLQVRPGVASGATRPGDCWLPLPPGLDGAIIGLSILFRVYRYRLDKVVIKM